MILRDIFADIGLLHQLPSKLIRVFSFIYTLPKDAKKYPLIAIQFNFENEARKQRGEDNQFGNTYSAFKTDGGMKESADQALASLIEQGGSEAEFRFRVRLASDIDAVRDVIGKDDGLWSEWSEWRSFG